MEIPKRTTALQESPVRRRSQIIKGISQNCSVFDGHNKSHKPHSIINCENNNLLLLLVVLVVVDHESDIARILLKSR